jgi:predicted nucleotidyltransferase
VFGSRAQGRHRPESDVDLALYGELEERLVARIAGELEELPLPYSFDVLAYAGLRHGALQAHIDRVGPLVFERSELST